MSSQREAWDGDHLIAQRIHSGESGRCRNQLANSLPIDSLELVAQSAVVTALKAAFLTLALARFHQVFQASGALDGLRSALRTSAVPLHPQLVLALPGNRQICVLVFNAFSH